MPSGGASTPSTESLKGRNQLPKVIEGIKFKDGIEETNDTENRAA
jgi:putative transposase